MFFVEFLPEKQQKTSIIPRKNTGKGFDEKFKSGSETPRFLAIDTQRGGVIYFTRKSTKTALEGAAGGYGYGDYDLLVIVFALVMIILRDSFSRYGSGAGSRQWE